jgi:hypoxanthine phosphoribosyltransferase
LHRVIAAEEAKRIFAGAELICSAEEAQRALRRIAAEVTVRLGDKHPLVLPVMGGAVVFTGQLLPLLEFPLDFDAIQVSRYREQTSGGKIEWRIAPRANVKDRVVLVVDDILDEGQTLAAIRDKVMELGAKEFYAAVFADKNLGRPKPIEADFVGVKVPDRYVFGFGMDVHGAWRNLPAIYALRNGEA